MRGLWIDMHDNSSVMCDVIWRDNVIACARCKKPFNDITASDLAAIGHDLARIHRECSIPGPPKQIRRLVNFTKAAISHVFSGAPTCTQEQIDERYAVCRDCHLYIPDADNPEIGHCGHEDCGCGISRVAGYVKKLAWADQSCPLKKWLAISPPKNPAQR